MLSKEYVIFLYYKIVSDSFSPPYSAVRNPLQCLKETISEMEHTSRNVMPLLDATVGLHQECRIHYGEQTLDTTADRRGEGSDPTQRARIGYKVDIIIEYQELSWLLAIGCGEVAGGLPQCSRAKEWTDTLKLGLELRDIWYKAQNELEVSTAADLIIWGFTVIALFHLVLVKKIALPSSLRDLINEKHAYRAMLAFNEKMEMTKRKLDAANQERVDFQERMDSRKRGIGRRSKTQ
ncbi:hypothetical protein BC936DRAFT_146416 [Jimgerdemannia flammicorona]|uniref:Uncharacterized protein n=1 Tax=Jimgerdemannia flammicorona TaxID=994334 RepID=A0A433D7Q4_9FUNG|nr:hypothetical protein BC936DRAFT_146416 [Jimgerdemannia flammicorona]